MLGLVMLLFAVLWMPYHTPMLLNCCVAQPLLDPRVLLFCRICVYTNSAVNPVIYSLLSQKFRMAFPRLCRRGRGATEVRSPSHQLQCGPRDASEDTDQKE